MPMDITIPRNGGNVEFQHTAATTSDLVLFQILKSGLEIKTLAGRNNGGNDGEIEIVAGTKYIVKLDNDDLKPVPYNGTNCTYKFWKFNTVTNQWEVLQSGSFGVQEEQGSQPPPEMEVKYAKVVTTNRMPASNELQDVDLIILKNPDKPDKVFMRDGETFRQLDDGALKYAIYITRKQNVDFDFSQIDFSYANLQGANLQGAYFVAANLTNAILNLSKSEFKTIVGQGNYDPESTIWIDGNPIGE